MSIKEDLLDKIERLKEISPEEGAPFFDPLVTAINTYFNSCSGYVSNVNECIDMMNADIYRRTVVYENEFDKKMPTNYPPGYFNFWDCFYNAEEILNADETEFVNAWVYEQDPQPEPPPEPAPEPTYHIKENTKINEWVATLQAKQEIGSKTIDNITEWCKHSGGNSFLIAMFEDRGKVITALTPQEIADIIYKDRNLKEVMSELQIDAFLPSYE